LPAVYLREAGRQAGVGEQIFCSWLFHDSINLHNFGNILPSTGSLILRPMAIADYIKTMKAPEPALHPNVVTGK